MAGIRESKSVLLIIPCYNEGENVSTLFDNIKQPSIPGCIIKPLFINDASSDNTADTLRAIHAPFLENSVNLGIGGAVQLGFLYAQENGFHYAVQVDGDGQHPPSELEKILQPLFNGEADVVIGSRFLEKNKAFRSTFFRRVGINVISGLNKMLVGVRITDSTSGFRAYNRAAMAHLVAYYPDEYPEPESIVYLLHKKMRLKEVSVNMAVRSAGTSSITSLYSLYYMGKVVLNTLFLHLRMKNG